MIVTRFDTQPGTYALILQSSAEQRLQIGKLGQLDVKPGFYVYIGSAFGPGGLTARVARHQRKAKKLRWHIDYLTTVMSVEQVWYTLDTNHRECQWSEVLRKIRGADMPLSRFGSSDCACPNTSMVLSDTAFPARIPPTASGIDPNPWPRYIAWA